MSDRSSIPLWASQRRFLHRLSLPIICLFLLFLPAFAQTRFVTSPARAADQQPPWQTITGVPVSPADADRLLAQRRPLPLQAKPLSPRALPANETEATSEIVNLARALGNDPRRIFEFVQQNIEYTPTFGSAQGATATLLARRGNDCDQASLLIALLRAAGIAAIYQVGTVDYPADAMALWLGVDTNYSGNLLASGGIPVTPIAGGWRITRVWVKATIGGQDYPLDPAMKHYDLIAGINLSPVTGYDSSTFFNRALSGATLEPGGDPYSVRNIAESNIRGDLQTFGMNLANYLRDNHPDYSTAQVIGGRKIATENWTGWPTALPHALAVGTPTGYSDLPASMQHTLQLQLQLAGIDYTFKTFQIAARRLSIFYSGRQALLKVDGEMVVPVGTAAGSMAQETMQLTIDHAYPDPGYGDQTASFALIVSDSYSYVVMHDFDGASPQVMERRQRRLGQALREGLDAASESVRGETLAIYGQSLYRQESLYHQIIERLCKVRILIHHRIGLVGQENVPFFDIAMDRSSTVATDGSTESWKMASRARSLFGSALEHGVLEQQDPATGAAVSTIKGLWRNAADGRRTFLATNSNWIAGIKPLLQNYPASVIAYIEASLAANPAAQKFILPEYGDTAINDWKGLGFINYFHSGSSLGMGMLIYGGLTAGGSRTTTGTVNPPHTQTVHNNTMPPPNQSFQQSIYDYLSGEPVDMNSGAFVHQQTDLQNRLPEPLSLGFRRFYHSNACFAAGPLGYGWSHNYDMAAAQVSDGAGGLGARSGIDAAALIIAVQAAVDLVSQEPDVRKWAVAIYATEWSMEQLINNMVTVWFGDRALQFRRLADGTSYGLPPGRYERLTGSAAAGWQVKNPHGSQWEFNAEGQVTAWKDPNDNTASFTYDAFGRLATVKDAFLRQLTFSYNAAGLIGTVSDGSRTLQYSYDASGNLTRYTDAGGAQWGYEYDASSRLATLRKADPTTQALVTNTYDEQGLIKEQVDGLGQKTEFFFSGWRNREKTPNGGEVPYELDRAGFVLRRWDQQGNLVSIVRDGFGRPTQVTNRRGGVARLGYHWGTGQYASATDAMNQQTVLTWTARAGDEALFDRTRIDYADGTNEQFTYDAHGNMLTRRDRAGKLWTMTYNTRGQLLTIQNPTGGILTRTYNAAGLPASEQDNDAGIGATTLVYDALLRLTRMTHPDSTHWDWTYDSLDRMTSETDENGIRTAYSYDANGNLIQVTDADGAPLARSRTYTYNALNQPTRLQDAATAQTQYAYNYRGGLEQVTDHDNQAIQIGYDPRYHINGVTDQAGNQLGLGLNEEADWISVTSPAGRLIRFTRNARGSITGITDPLGQTVTLQRNAVQRVTDIQDRLKRHILFAYDGEGRLTSLTMPVLGTVQYARNDIGRVTRITDPLNGLWDFTFSNMGRSFSFKDPTGNTWNYSYDNRGRMAQVAFPGGGNVTRTLDGAGRLTQLQYSGGPNQTFTHDALNRIISTAGTDVPVNITYDARDRVTGTTISSQNFTATYNMLDRLQTAGYPGGFTVTYTYDSRGLLTQVGDTLDSNRILLFYDADWMLIRIQRSNGITTELQRDANARIIGIRHGTLGSLNFSLDAEDRITQLISNLPTEIVSLLSGELRRYNYNAAGQITGAGYSYDLRGRRTGDPGAAYTWDGADRLVSTTPQGETIITYTYTAFGEVVSRVQGVNTTEYFYNYAIGNRPIAAERKNGVWRRFYVHTPDGRLLYAINPADNTPSYYHYNHLGHTLFLTNAAGSITDSYAYNPFGEYINHQGSSDQPFTYVGEQGVRQEPGTRLLHMRARWFDRGTMRFLTRDPLWPDWLDPRGLNPYQYASLNPLSFIDPSGLIPPSTPVTAAPNPVDFDSAIRNYLNPPQGPNYAFWNSDHAGFVENTPVPTVFGQPVTFTSAVPPLGAGTPPGTATFLDNTSGQPQTTQQQQYNANGLNNWLGPNWYKDILNSQQIAEGYNSNYESNTYSNDFVHIKIRSGYTYNFLQNPYGGCGCNACNKGTLAFSRGDGTGGELMIRSAIVVLMLGLALLVWLPLRLYLSRRGKGKEH